MNLDENGLHLHQSDIETYMQCPEKLRLGLIASMGDESSTSDAAFVGTCVHGVIEHELQADEPFGSLAEAQAFGAWYFVDAYGEMVARGTTYSRETFNTDSRALAALKPLVQSWYESSERDMLMSMEREDYQVEFEFDEPFTITPNGSKIYLAGRGDLCVHNRVWDWKTASSMRQYEPWERQRWAVQPTVYLWAAARAGMIQPVNDVYVFEYKVLVRGKKATPFNTVTVRRTVKSFTWLERICQNIALTMEVMGIDNEWPLNDHSALCGPKWCPHWANCKGAYINSETWT